MRTDTTTGRATARRDRRGIAGAGPPLPLLSPRLGGGAVATSPPRGAGAVRDVWRRLATPTAEPAPFSTVGIDGLPEPARRWLTHAITPSTPLWRSVELEMQGRIRLGSWRSFRARQVLVPGVGFIWAATTRVAGLPVSGYDRYSDGAGEMRWRLCGLLPVVTATGEDVTRSAAGRLAGEGVLVPTAFSGAHWAASGPDAVTASWTVGRHRDSVDLQVGPAGELRSVTMQRWGNPSGERYGRYPFGVELDREVTFEGITVPTVLRAGWFHGTPREADGEFFRAVITAASWR